MREKALFLKREAAAYMDTLEMTPAERQELLAWVQGGNSVYDNPWYMANEQGYPMDYISAVREVDDYRLANSS